MTNRVYQLEIKEHKKGPKCIKVRYIQVVLLFTLLVIMFSIRICLSVAIVAMTSNGTSSNPNVPYYSWGNSNIILSSFYWSYAILQFFAGNLAHYFGTKNMLFVATFMNSLSCALIPMAANYFGSNGVMLLRIVQGLFQGFMLPCLSAVVGRWLPPNELTFINSILYSGAYFGIILSMITTGYISASWWGWPAAFYLLGFIGFVWCIFWFLLSADSPATHQKISPEERKYIEHSLGQEDDHLIDKKTIPWGAIMKSLPYWAIIVAAVGESWSTTFLTTELPSYLSYALGLNIQDSSLFSAAPTIGGLIASLCFGSIAGFTIKKGYVSTVNSRRIFHGFGAFSAALGLVFLPYLSSKTVIAVVLIASTTASAAATCGHFINVIDLSPRYAGILSGFANGVGQLIAMLAPVLVHFMVKDESDKSLWRNTFILAAVIAAGSAVFFMIFCSGERQWWDDVDKRKWDVARNGTSHEKESQGKTNAGFQNDLTV